MEKLIELLEQFKEEEWYKDCWMVYWWFWVRRWDVNFIFRKQFPFVRRLVSNDKIDKEKVIKAETLPILDINEDYVLMLLSIQDNPIDVLISILK